MIYKTRWKHRKCSDYIYIEPETFLNEIIDTLEKTVGTKYFYY